MTDLGTPAGAPNGVAYGAANAINDRGQVVGASYNATLDRRAVLWMP